MKRHAFLLLLLVALTGCATAYRERSFFLQDGYSSTKIQEGIYKVAFSGNGFTSADRAEDFALLRAAEITLLNRYHYFTIIDSQSKNSVSTYTTPVQANTSGSYNGYGNYSSTTTYTGGDVYVINRPSTVITIRCHVSMPDTDQVVYDAQQIWANIRWKYRLDQ